MPAGAYDSVMRNYRSRQFVLSLSVALSLSFVLASCGSSGPGASDVAVVDGNPISKETLDKGVAVAQYLQGQAVATGSVIVPVPDPPEFKKCIVQMRASLQQPGKTAVLPSDRQLKGACSSQYDSVKNQVMSSLLRAKWFALEADELNVKVSDSEVNQLVKAFKANSFGRPADYQRYLSRTHQTAADVQANQRNVLIEQKVNLKAAGNIKPPSAAAVRAYEAKNRSKLVSPETRDLDIILTTTKAKAQAALTAIENGMSYATASTKFADVPGFASTKGRIISLTPQIGDKALVKAVFSSPAGKRIGPVQIGPGWTVFQVTKITPGGDGGSQGRLDKAEVLLISENQQKATLFRQEAFTEKWRALTECSAGFVVPECDNFKLPKTTTVPGVTTSAKPTG